MLARLFRDVEVEGRLEALFLVALPGEMLRSLRGPRLETRVLSRLRLLVTELRQETMWSDCMVGPAREFCDTEFRRE